MVKGHAWLMSRHEASIAIKPTAFGHRIMDQQDTRSFDAPSRLKLHEIALLDEIWRAKA